MSTQPRRRYRPSTATWILFAIIVTLAVIIARGPAKFFAARTVEHGVSCTLRDCPNMTDEPDGHIWRRYQPPRH